MPVLIVELGDQSRKDGDGIGHGATEESAVQIPSGAAHKKLHRRNATQGVGEGRLVTRGHRRVRDRNKIAGELLSVLFEKITEIGAADLFLPLDQEDDIDRQGSFFPQGFRHAENVGQNLSLVVGSSTRVDPPPLDTRLKGWRRPAGKWLGRLHVVVTVDQHRALGGIPRRGRDHHR